MAKLSGGSRTVDGDLPGVAMEIACGWGDFHGGPRVPRPLTADRGSAISCCVRLALNSDKLGVVGLRLSGGSNGGRCGAEGVLFGRDCGVGDCPSSVGTGEGVVGGRGVVGKEYTDEAGDGPNSVGTGEGAVGGRGVVGKEYTDEAGVPKSVNGVCAPLGGASGIPLDDEAGVVG